MRNDESIELLCSLNDVAREVKSAVCIHHCQGILVAMCVYSTPTAEKFVAANLRKALPPAA